MAELPENGMNLFLTEVDFRKVIFKDLILCMFAQKFNHVVYRKIFEYCMNFWTNNISIASAFIIIDE